MGQRFENMLMAAERSPKTWRDALAAVGDTALICRAWLEECGHPITAADIVAMTRIVIERETAMIALLPPAGARSEGDVHSIRWNNGRA